MTQKEAERFVGLLTKLIRQMIADVYQHDNRLRANTTEDTVQQLVVFLKESI